MTAVSRADNAVSKIGRIFESIGKYALDSAVNVSSKGFQGRLPLHKTVQEELKDQVPLKQCKDKPTTLPPEKEMQAKIEKMQEEINTVKHSTVASSEKMQPVSAKVPREQFKEKSVLVPNKKRIMIRSRL